ncbi:hypothetical protein VB773_13025 [Haloarculaceae archaeon H-GB2-1]|nr:hypothetical protein [Haloarculaceae archaeon H-GB11]MEA5408394.1 hypothetical protein [Haloarculaceae archaeon H-GB2-1]
MTVQSEYYEAWGTYFEQRTEGSVQYDHANERVTLTLVVPAKPRIVRTAVAATAAAGGLKIPGNGARTDSYSSADGDGYTGDPHGEGNISTAGDFEITGNADVVGNVRTGGNANVQGSATVDGNVYYTGSDDRGGTVTGDWFRIDGVDGDNAIDSVVDEETDAYDSQNNNSGTAAAGGSITSSGDLWPGNYSVDRIYLTTGETLTVNTNGQEVVVAVDDYIRLDGGTINVEGDGVVRFYVAGENRYVTGNEKYFMHLKDGTVDIANHQNSTQLWIYGKKYFNASIKDSTGEGVIYAPGGPTGGGELTMKQSEWYGSVAVSSVTLKQGSAVHYDTALRNKRAIPDQKKIVRLTYMHVTVNKVNVTG